MANVASGVVERNIQTDSGTCVTDLSNSQNLLVNESATVDDQYALAVDGSKPAYPVRDGNNGSVTPATCGIAVGGRVKVVAGGTITAGQPVMPNSSGQGIVATSGNYSCGIAKTNAVVNQVFAMEVRIFRMT